MATFVDLAVAYFQDMWSLHTMVQQCSSNSLVWCLTPNSDIHAGAVEADVLTLFLFLSSEPMMQLYESMQ